MSNLRGMKKSGKIVLHLEKIISQVSLKIGFTDNKKANKKESVSEILKLI